MLSIYEVKKMAKENNALSFSDWLEAMYGCSESYADNNFSGEEYDEAYDEYVAYVKRYCFYDSMEMQEIGLGRVVYNPSSWFEKS